MAHREGEGEALWSALVPSRHCRDTWIRCANDQGLIIGRYSGKYTLTTVV